MLAFKKIVAAIFMVLSIIAIVVLIIALFGSWVVRSRLETITVNLLLAGENVIAATQEGLDRVDGILQTSHNTVTEIDSAIKDVGADIRDGDPVFVQFLDSRGIDLKMGIENAASTFN